MMLGAWMRGVIRLMRETLLLSLLISFILIIVAGHVHFRPIGISLFVSAWFLFVNPLEAILLGVVLELAVEAVFPVLVGVVHSLHESSWSVT